MEREEPKPGEKWRHFKGDEYSIIAIGYTIALSGKLAFFKKFVIHAKSSSFGTRIAPYTPIYHTGTNDVFYVTETDLNTEEKIFPLTLSTTKQTSRSPIDEKPLCLWACPINDFMGRAISPYGEQASNWYRFERIL